MTLALCARRPDGYTLSWNGTAAALTAEDLELTATPGALYVEVNGRALYVEHGVQVRDGRIALPLEVLGRGRRSPADLGRGGGSRLAVH